MLRPVRDATLVLPPGYVVLAPICALLDALTLLSLAQHLALLATGAVLYAIWRWRRRRRGAGRHSAAGAIGREGGLAIAALGLWLAVYAVGALVPRPMARIRLRDPQSLTVDFHSHTNASWDGRRSFDAAANRAWHTAAGFDVAYVSDHKSMAGAAVAMQTNPAHGGDGAPTILLPGLEARDGWEHVIAIGMPLNTPFDPRGNWTPPPAGANALLVLTLPGNVHTIPADEGPTSSAPLAAVELADAAPKGVGAVQRERGAILQLADARGLATVAGSDNHGWGRTAQAWTVMRIPAWRSLTPMALDSAIIATIRAERRGAARVIMRDSPDAGRSPMALAATAPAVLWTLLRNLTWGERVSCIVWLLLLSAVATGVSRLRTTAR